MVEKDLWAPFCQRVSWDEEVRGSGLGGSVVARDDDASGG